MSRKKMGRCALCGVQAETTQEHFVPRCLWTGPRPNRVETVPACDACNGGSNQDDEYFRNALVMMFDQEHPQKKELLDGPVMRTLGRHPGWVRHMLENARVGPQYSPAGLWIGNFPILPLDLARFNRSLLKIVKGLYYLIRHKQPFPLAGTIGLVGILNEDTKPLIDLIEQKLLPPTFSFGDDVFEWRFCQTRDGLTMWKLAFYRSVVYYAVAADDAAALLPLADEARKNK
jgi:hypothetical protein